MRRTPLLLAALALCALLAACASRTRPEPRGPDAAAAYPGPAASAPVVVSGGPGASAGAGACAADGDCVSVKADCCGCTAGGQATAVPRAQQAAYEAARAQRCATVECIQMMSNHPSCFAPPRCVSGRCRLGP